MGREEACIRFATAPTRRLPGSAPRPPSAWPSSATPPSRNPRKPTRHSSRRASATAPPATSRPARVPRRLGGRDGVRRREVGLDRGTFDRTSPTTTSSSDPARSRDSARPAKATAGARWRSRSVSGRDDGHPRRTLPADARHGLVTRPRSNPAAYAPRSRCGCSASGWRLRRPRADKPPARRAGRPAGSTSSRAPLRACDGRRERAGARAERVEHADDHLAQLVLALLVAGRGGDQRSRPPRSPLRRAANAPRAPDSARRAAWPTSAAKEPGTLARTERASRSPAARAAGERDPRRRDRLQFQRLPRSARSRRRTSRRPRRGDPVEEPPPLRRQRADELVDDLPSLNAHGRDRPIPNLREPVGVGIDLDERDLPARVHGSLDHGPSSGTDRTTRPRTRPPARRSAG